MSQLAGSSRLRFQAELGFISSTVAHQLLDEIPDQQTPLPNPIASSTAINQSTENRSSWFGFTTALRLIATCVQSTNISSGRPLHCLAIKTGFSLNPFIGSSLVDLYSKCRLLKDASFAFDDVSSRDLVLWNVMVSCYSLNGLGLEAFGAFESMRKEGLYGDGFTFSSLLSSCSSLGCVSIGKQTHGLVIKLVSGSDIVASSALIDMYVKCGLINEARRAFDVMDRRNVVSWNSIIVGYGQHGEGKKAMKLLGRMIRGDSKPDELTLASVLSACADSAAINEATQIHGFVVKNGFKGFVSVGNALVVAYSKSGCICNAFECFSSITRPDSVSWNSMVSAYAFHGLAEKAIEIFERMVEAGVRPDKVAFLGVISACSHAGLVEQGLHYFASMRKDYQIEPGSVHYTCLVDLLGRANHLSDAHTVIRNMPIEPDGDVLAAFMGACKVQGNTELAKWAAERLLRLQPEVAPNYKVMANIYATLGHWDDVARVRKMMRDTCTQTHPGCSWIEIGDRVHAFLSTDESHPQATELYIMLRLLVEMMKKEGVSGDHLI